MSKFRFVFRATMLILSLPFFMQCSTAPARMEDLSLKYTVTRAEVGEVEGIPFTKTICSMWDPVRKFKARPDDLLIAAYAKAGWCG